MSALHSTKPPIQHRSAHPGRRLSGEEIEAIVEDRRLGMSVSAIATKRGVSRPTVYRALERGKPSKAGSGQGVRVYSRLSVEDYDALKAVAADRGETVAALSRRVLRRAAGFFDADRDIAAAALELSVEMKKIGTNLNQVVYQINREALLQGRGTPSNAHLKSIRDMQKAVLSAADEVDKLFVRAGRRRLATVEQLLAKGDR